MELSCIPLEISRFIGSFIPHQMYPVLILVNNNRKFCKLFHHQQISVTYIDFVKFSIKNNYANLLKNMFIKESRYNKLICKIAARHGNLGILKWARENGCAWYIRTCAAAAKGGHLEVLKWLRENNCEWNCRTFTNAARNNHLDILKWAYANGCTCDCEEYYDNDDKCVYIAGNVAYLGYFEVLKWLHEIQYVCQWNFDVCLFAARGGHLDILKWAHNAGYDWDSRTYVTVIEQYSLNVLSSNDPSRRLGIELLKWIYDNGCPFNKILDIYLPNHKLKRLVKSILHNSS